MMNLYGMWKSGTAKPPDKPMRQMLTPWGEHLDPQDVRSEHPRPQFARKSFQSLNGYWDYAIVSVDEGMQWTAPDGVTTDAPDGDPYDGSILVPFSPESMLSGVGRELQPDELLVYHRQFETLELQDGERLVLHFEAVDHLCDCYVDGVHVGSHVGGYIPFSFDVTDALSIEREQNGGHPSPFDGIVLVVWDPTDAGAQPRGKQKLDSGGIWYTAQSGIWQPVWFETVPARHVERVSYRPDLSACCVGVDVDVAGASKGDEVTITVSDADGKVAGSGSASYEGDTDEGVIELSIPIEVVHPWTPDDPHLYDVLITFGDDSIESYLAFRTISLGWEEPEDASDPSKRRVIMLNGEPCFMKGLLDQGYWSDGLMTAPSDDAVIHDIETAKSLGFNMLRKHIKVECDRYYYHCDRLGMLVWQDMVQGGEPYDEVFVGNIPSLFRFMWDRFSDVVPWHMRRLGSFDRGYWNEWTDTCRETVEHLRNHPCIVAWTLFNEGWGQFGAKEAERMVRELDPCRLIDSVSGWYDMHSGDFQSVHNYFRKLAVYRDYRGARRLGRAFAISEFGGYTYHVPACSSYKSSYGYMQFDDLGRWRNAVEDVLGAVERLKENGLSCYVYTQLSDVEEETNGLLTFDRRLNKVTGEAMGLELEGSEWVRQDGSGERIALTKGPIARKGGDPGRGTDASDRGVSDDG